MGALYFYMSVLQTYEGVFDVYTGSRADENYLFRTNFVIPKVSLTAAEITSLWASIPFNTATITALNTFINGGGGIDQFGIVSASPVNGIDFTEFSDFQTYLGLFPLCNVVSQAWTYTNDIVIYAYPDSTNYFEFNAASPGTFFVKDGVRLSTTVGSGTRYGLGIVLDAFGSSDAISALIISSDNIVIRLITTSVNRGNCSFNVWDSTTSGYIIDFLENAPEPFTPSNDPYEPGGTSGTGGGGGDFDGSSTPIDFPNLPTVSAVDTGFITLFNPSLSEIQQLADFMWGTLDVDNWRKIFVDPMDAILGLSIVPVAVPDGGQREVCVGIARTNVFMNIAASQYVIVDCGSINVNEYWGAYLDYDPYTKVEIYLPYIGTRPLAADDIMDKTITVRYHVDILSGGCVCFIKCGDSVLYTFVGQCASSIPISGNDWTNVMNGVLEIAAAIGTMVATEGASIPVTLSAGAAAASGMTTALRPNVERSAAMSGAGGMLGMQTPYLILTRPNQCLPANQNAFTGYPSFITTTLGNCSGYTEVEKVHLEGLQATAEELTEIESFLRGGVLF